MTYLPTPQAPPDFSFRRRGTLRHYGGIGDDADFTIGTIIAAFLPKLNEIQAASDQQVQQQVQDIVDKVSGEVQMPADDFSQRTPSVVSTATGGAVSASDFNPPVGNVCKAKNFPALRAAKELQLQMNRVAKARGLGAITVDGEIGPQTVSLLGRISPSSAPTCTAITANLTSLTSAVKSMADSAGAPPPSPNELAQAANAGAITVPTRAGNMMFKPPGAKAGIFETVKALPDTTKIILGGVALLGGVFAFKKLRSRGGARPAAAPALPAAAPVGNPRRRRRRRR